MLHVALARSSARGSWAAHPRRNRASGRGAWARPSSTRRVQRVFSAVLPVLRLELNRGAAHSRVLPRESSRPGW